MLESYNILLHVAMVIIKNKIIVGCYYRGY